MRAIRITGPQHMEVVDAPVPTLAEGQVLVRAERLSICGSDMRTYRHVAPEEEYPLAPGVPCHEIVGVVQESRSARCRPRPASRRPPTVGGHHRRDLRRRH